MKKILFFYFLCLILGIYSGYVLFKEDNIQKYQELRYENKNPIIYISQKQSRPKEVEDCFDEVEKKIFSINWDNKFGIEYIDYYTSISEYIADNIIEKHGFKRNEYGFQMSLFYSPELDEHFLVISMKLYKTGYEGQFYIEWVLSEKGTKPPKDFSVPSVPFREPRKKSYENNITI